MEEIHLIQDLLQEGDWFIKTGLKNAYFAVPIHPNYRGISSVSGSGYSISVRLPTLWSKFSIRSIHKDNETSNCMATTGCHMISYIDDNLLVAKSRQEASLLGQIAVPLPEGPGFVIKYKKSDIEPKQEMQFLGFSIDSKRMSIAVPPQKVTKIAELAAALLTTEKKQESLAKFIGRASSMKLAIPPAPYSIEHCKQQRTR